MPPPPRGPLSPTSELSVRGARAVGSPAAPSSLAVGARVVAAVSRVATMARKGVTTPLSTRGGGGAKKGAGVSSAVAVEVARIPDEPLVVVPAVGVAPAVTVVAAAVSVITVDPIPIPLITPDPLIPSGSVTCLFNHYTRVLPTALGGELHASAIDAEMSFNFAYRGDFRLHLVPAIVGGKNKAPGFAPVGPADISSRAKEEIRLPIIAVAVAVALAEVKVAGPASEGDAMRVPAAAGSEAGASANAPHAFDANAVFIVDPDDAPHNCGHVVFTHLQPGSFWRVEVEDDPTIVRPISIPLSLTTPGAGACSVIVRGGGSNTSTRSAAAPGARAAAELTNQLKNLSVDELRAGSAKYKELLEARELESTLYGAG